MAINRAVMVYRRSPLEELVLKNQTFDRARFLLEKAGRPITSYEVEAKRYESALELVGRQVPTDLQVIRIRREQLPHFQFRGSDLIIVCGPDGLFANVAKFLHDQPIVTVNPGVFGAGELMLHAPENAGSIIARVLAGTHKVERLPFVRALIDNERVVWGINDILVGRPDKATAWYTISHEGKEEDQGSDGVLISTGIGSTGWIRSIANTIEAGMLRSAPHKLSSMPAQASNELVFFATNPVKSPTTGLGIVTGRITPGRPLVVRSRMPEGGVVVSDGVLDRPEPWEAGSEVVISVGDRYVQRVAR